MTRRWLLSLPFIAPFVKKAAAQTYTTPMMTMPPASGKILNGFMLDVDTGDGRRIIYVDRLAMPMTDITRERLLDLAHLDQNTQINDWNLLLRDTLPSHTRTPQYPANADS